MEEFVPATEIDTGSVRTPQSPVGTVGVPCRDFMNTDTVLSIYATDWSGLPVDFLIHKGNVLTMQRNSLVQRMRGDWLLFIDDDMVWEADAVKRLVQSLADLKEAGETPDVLGALCFRRAVPYQPTLYVRYKEGPYNYLEDWEGRYIEVDATGMAFCLITKECFERVAGSPMPTFEERMKMDKLPDFFRWHGALGEDLRFCQDVRKAGGRIIVDTEIRIGHMSETRRGYGDFLREVSEREPEITATRRKISKEMNILPPLSKKLAKEKLRGLA